MTTSILGLKRVIQNPITRSRDSVPPQSMTNNHNCDEYRVGIAKLNVYASGKHLVRDAQSNCSCFASVSVPKTALLLDNCMDFVSLKSHNENFTEPMVDKSACAPQGNTIRDAKSEKRHELLITLTLEPFKAHRRISSALGLKRVIQNPITQSRDSVPPQSMTNNHNCDEYRVGIAKLNVYASGKHLEGDAKPECKQFLSATCQMWQGQL